MKEFNPDKVGMEILNEIFSHGITIEDLYKNFNDDKPVDVEIKKEFQTSRSKFTLTATFSMLSLHYLVATLSITKRFEAITDVENGCSMPVEVVTLCGIAGRMSDGYIPEAKVVAEDNNLDFLYFEGQIDETANVVQMVRPDTHEPMLFLEQIKLLLDGETIYKDEIQVKETLLGKETVKCSIPIKRNSGIFS